MANCKKEYRTQWELNSHHRLKHSKPESTGDIEYTVQIEYNTANEQTSTDSISASATIEPDRTEVAAAKRKHRNNAQQIIYVMPGPDQWLKFNIYIDFYRLSWLTLERKKFNFNKNCQISFKKPNSKLKLKLISLIDWKSKLTKGVTRLNQTSKYSTRGR